MSRTSRSTAQQAAWRHFASFLTVSSLLLPLLLLSLLQGAGCASPPLDPEQLKSDALWALGEGDVSSALERLRRATELAPTDPEAHFMLAGLALRNQRLEEAEAALARAVELDPRNGLYRSAHGVALKKLGRYPEAESVLSHALLLSPGDPPTLASLAEVYRMVGKSERCIVRYAQFERRLSRGGAAQLGEQQAQTLAVARNREQHCRIPGADETAAIGLD